MKKIMSLVLVGLLVCMSVSVMAGNGKVEKRRLCYEYGDALMTPLPPVIGDNKVIYCDSSIMFDTRSESGNTNSKWLAHREIYINGTFVVKEKQVFNYNFNTNANVYIIWTADVNYDEATGKIETCSVLGVSANGGEQVNKDVCESVAPLI